MFVTFSLLATSRDALVLMVHEGVFGVGLKCLCRFHWEVFRRVLSSSYFQ